MCDVILYNLIPLFCSGEVNHIAIDICAAIEIGRGCQFNFGLALKRYQILAQMKFLRWIQEGNLISNKFKNRFVLVK